MRTLPNTDASLTVDPSLADAEAVKLLLASGRVGLVHLDERLTVAGRSGTLVDWVEVGVALSEAVPALFGYEDLLGELRQGRRDGFSLPRIRFPVSANDDDPFFSIRAFRIAASGEIALLFQDVTELGLMEQKVVQQRNELALAQQALREARDKADSANRAKSAFLANVSHELRTPLTVIIGNAEILRDRDVAAMEPTQRAGFLVDIHDNGVFLLELINDLLDLSKAEAGRIDLIEEVFQPEVLLEDVLTMVRALPYADGVSLKLERAGPLPLLCADRLRVKQILINLLTNAVKFTADGGTVVITAEREPDGGLSVIVADSGVGMSEDDLARVAQPFVQGQQTARAGQQGTGLGLHLISILIDLHGGSVEHRSRPGAGTTVRLRFPAERVVNPKDEQGA